MLSAFGLGHLRLRFLLYLLLDTFFVLGAQLVKTDDGHTNKSLLEAFQVDILGGGLVSLQHHGVRRR